MKHRTKKLLLTACIQGLLGLQPLYAATYYVSPTGSDSNTGTSLTTPVKTINNGLNKAKASGDIVYVMTGTYNETVSIGQNGITLSAYPNNTPVIDGGNTLPRGDWGVLLSVYGNNNTVSGFEVKNSNTTGTYVGGYGLEVSGHHNTISKMNVHHIWETGVLLGGDYNTVEDSTIWQAARRNSTNTGQVTSGWATGMSAARNRNASALKPGITSYATFRRNKVYNNWGEGLSCFEADHCTMEDNIVYDNWTINLYISDTTNSLIQRNMVYVSSNPAIPTRRNAAPAAITLADEVASKPRSANNTIINNFIYNTDFDAFSWTEVANSGLKNVLIANNTIVGGGLFTGSGGNPAIVNTNSQIRNNIILGADSAIPSKNGITFSNNNWSVLPAVLASTNIAGDPRVAKTGATTAGALTPNYFKLLAGSPMIGVGVTVAGVTTDFFKVARKATAPDIGAHEFTTATTPAPAPVIPAPTPVIPAPTPVVPAPTPVVPAPTPVVPAPTPVVPAPTPVVPAPTPVVPA
ncbi:MAG: right-handed parallel beta-helix repeat-containing protein, partial [Methylococcales bacterium]|nr:right-handed parallel beta-helix repeat-containing protein [Methylococcales bacterium]